MINPRWRLVGHIDGPVVSRDRDGGTAPPNHVIEEMLGMLKPPADCEFVEVLDRDQIIEIEQADGSVERKFKTVFCAESPRKLKHGRPKAP